MSKDPKLGVTLHYQYPIYSDFIQPNGALTLDKRSHACFYYTVLAMRSLALYAGGIDNQRIQVETGREHEVPWHESRFEEIARSVALLYQLESPDEFLKFKKEAWTQAVVFLGRQVDSRIYDVRPGIQRLH